MKKAIAIAMALLMLLVCCACGETPSSNTSSTGSTSSQNTSDVSSDVSSEDTSSEQEEVSAPAQTVTTTTPAGVVLDDMPLIESNIVLDEGLEFPDILPEYGTQPSTLDTGWNATAPIKKGNTDEAADALRNEILNAKNTADIYDIKGTIYYVSPKGNDENDGKSPETAFQTTDAVIFTRNVLQPGDAVLFERGGLWRLLKTLKCKEGVTYGSYGEGEKPTFYSSPYNYGDAQYWVPSNKKNIWKLGVADADIGLIVFNHGELVGIKKLNGVVTLEKNGDFYYNKNDETLYFYYDGGNPGKAFDSIEVGYKRNLFSVGNPDVTIDNLRIKYTGAFGIGMNGCDNSVITNCEIGFIGGAIQSGETRYGNGIQVWNGVVGHRIENCWVYQVYDSGVTFQGNYTYVIDNMSDIYKDVTYKDNLFEYCTYSIEFWHAEEPSPATIENFNIVGNISRFAGYGWGSQRMNHSGNHICVFNHSFPNAKNNLFKDNLFDLADSFIVKWGFTSINNVKGFTFSNNTYYHGKNKFDEAARFGSTKYAYDLSSLESAIGMFESDPKLVVWVDTSELISQ